MRVPAGTVIALYGELGSGKTCLVQGIAAGLGVPASVPVNSPSFVIISEYAGRLPFFHVDLYRVRDWRDVFDLGWDDYLEKRGVIAIEWAERMGPLLPPGHIAITLEIAGETTRNITISGWPG
jgi:tRNA threonylcarbamoyladenosine biosynthesis protein TsaE